jgi:tRNA pseudouridine55 synthase
MASEELSELLGSIHWESVFSKFRGEIMQTPPMYSAKKIEGKKLYEFARRGVEVAREPVTVQIQRLELVQDEHHTRTSALRIRVHCSAGTYIRTLAEDIGREVGTGAHLLELRRTAAGRFGLKDAIRLETLEMLEDRASALLPIEDIVSDLPSITLDPERVEKTKNGLSTRIQTDRPAHGMHVKMLDAGASLIAIGIYDAEEKTVKPKIVLG